MKTVLVLCLCLLVGCGRSAGSSGTGGSPHSGIATEIRSAAAFLESVPSKADYNRRGYELRDALSRLPGKNEHTELALFNYELAGEHLDLLQRALDGGWKDLYEQNVDAIKDLSAKMKASADALD